MYLSSFAWSDTVKNMFWFGLRNGWSLPASVWMVSKTWMHSVEIKWRDSSFPVSILSFTSHHHKVVSFTFLIWSIPFFHDNPVIRFGSSNSIFLILYFFIVPCYMILISTCITWHSGGLSLLYLILLILNKSLKWTRYAWHRHDDTLYKLVTSHSEVDLLERHYKYRKFKAQKCNRWPLLF